MFNNTPHHYSGMEQTLNEQQHTEIKLAIQSLKDMGFKMFETKGFLYVEATRKTKYVGMTDLRDMQTIGEIVDISFKSKSITVKKKEKGYLLGEV